MLNFIKKIQEKEQARQQESRNPEAGRGLEGQERTTAPEVPRKIMVVGKGETLNARALDYALNLAERLGYGLIVLSVNPVLGKKKRFISPYQHYLRQRFSQRALAAGEAVKKQAAAKGVSFEQVVHCGDLGRAVADVNRQVKRIELVITQEGIREEEVIGEINLPIFSISGYQGEGAMTKESANRGALLGKTAGYGLAAAALYAAVFWHTDTVMHYFTRGSWYAALPIATVFVVSFVHGAFAHHLWEVLGIQAPKRVQPRPTAAKRPVARRRPRPELRINT